MLGGDARCAGPAVAEGASSVVSALLAARPGMAAGEIAGGPAVALDAAAVALDPATWACADVASAAVASAAVDSAAEVSAAALTAVVSAAVGTLAVLCGVAEGSLSDVIEAVAEAPLAFIAAGL